MATIIRVLPNEVKVNLQLAPTGIGKDWAKFRNIIGQYYRAKTTGVREAPKDSDRKLEATQMVQCRWRSAAYQRAVTARVAKAATKAGGGTGC